MLSATAPCRPTPRRAASIGLLLGVLGGCLDGRASAEEAARIAEALALGPGSVVADLGAGDGKWSEEMARRVGEDGHVWATEVEEKLVEDIRRRAERAGLSNLSAVLGDQQDTGLPDGCCNAALLRMVYHHFVDPGRMLEDLRRALRPGARVAVIDILPQTGWRELPGVPDRGGHGIPPALLIAEMSAAGFEVLERHDDWGDDEDRYCIVFGR